MTAGRRNGRNLITAIVMGTALAVLPPTGGFAQMQLNPTAVAPEPLDATTAVSRANDALNRMRAVTGQFVQVGPNGERAEGDFFLQRPGKLRFQYDPPSKLEVIADGSWVAIQDHQLRTTERYPLSATPLKLILSDNVDISSEASVNDIYEAGNFVTISLTADSSDTPGNLVLMFDRQSFELLQWTITDAQGLETSIAINNVSPGLPSDPGLFNIIDYVEVETGGNR